MKLLFMTLTAPLWLPVLFAVGSASIAVGMAVTVFSHALKDRPTSDNWRLD